MARSTWPAEVGWGHQCMSAASCVPSHPTQRMSREPLAPRMRLEEAAVGR